MIRIILIINNELFATLNIWYLGQCPYGLTGNSCETVINNCASNPCT